VRQERVKAADEAMQQPVLSVTQKPSPPPGGTVHDFQSLGPYWWPDPTRPGGLPYVRRDGEVNPEFYGESNDRPRLEKLAKAATTLALASLVEGNPKYANRIAVLVNAWFLDSATRMNPAPTASRSLATRSSRTRLAVMLPRPVNQRRW
jgi:hypothetical protein